MKEYFYTDGKERFGPFSIDDLKERNLTKSSLIWYEGMKDWIPANEIEELQYFFNSEPPEINPKANKEFTYILIRNKANRQSEKVSLSQWNSMIEEYGEDKFEVVDYLDEFGEKIVEDGHLTEKSHPPKTYLVESILVTVLCCVPFGVIGIVHATKVESEYYAGNIEAAKKASETASKWVNYGLITGLIGGAIYVAFMVFAETL